MKDKKGKLISEASARRKEMRSAQLELTIEGKRIYVRALGNNAVSVKLDVTPLWHFFKEAIKSHA